MLSWMFFGGFFGGGCIFGGCGDFFRRLGGLCADNGQSGSPRRFVASD